MSVEPKSDKSLDLLTAIVKGDAEIEDGIAELKREGITSLEEGLHILKEEAEANGSEGAVAGPDFASMRRKADPSVVANIKHVVPEVPFVLDGTFYDPAAIERFNGQELHFFTSPGKDHMLVVDDRNLMVDWLQFEYFQRYRDIPSLPRNQRMNPGAIWFEDDDLKGGRIGCGPNRGFWRLSKVKYDPLFGGDWNDRISSFEMWSIGVVQLSDAKNFEGPLWYHVVPAGTGYASVRSLRPYGWNDRTSSCGDW
ncbi:hypothetical protein [Streptomyces sp. NPDC051738]|uniref:hypothetical protein n=1 Tax=Streptomyces sp. NPDC051738 TaxID=3365672 RepID=UPI0037D61B89